MRQAGKYDSRLTWKKRTATKNPQNGQDEETFNDNGFLWAGVEADTGRVLRDYGSEQTGADVTIRVRNYPALSALDRLYSSEWNETYIIESIGRGNNELICTAFLYDELA
jgi:head-tail adaptor